MLLGFINIFQNKLVVKFAKTTAFRENEGTESMVYYSDLHFIFINGEKKIAATFREPILTEQELSVCN
jgi:hypothetical protein